MQLLTGKRVTLAEELSESHSADDKNLPSVADVVDVVVHSTIIILS